MHRLLSLLYIYQNLKCCIRILAASKFRICDRKARTPLLYYYIVKCSLRATILGNGNMVRHNLFLTLSVKLHPFSVTNQSTTVVDMTSSSPFNFLKIKVWWANGQAKDTYRWYRPCSALNPEDPSAIWLKMLYNMYNTKMQTHNWYFWYFIGSCSAFDIF